MPLSFTSISAKNKWFGSTWTVEDEDALAKLVSRVAVGQAKCVEHILRETECVLPGMPKGGFSGARQLLTVPADEPPWHRDGWVFQVLSWIAAHAQDNTALIRPPHMLQANKGQDGLIIEFDQDDIARIVICEDKATKNPRSMVRDEVLAEFSNYESGARDNELIAAVTSMLDRQNTKNSDAIVANILWNEKRAYRIAVTVDDRYTSKVGLEKLFKGYDKFVSGEVQRRRAEIIPLKDMRTWMQILANKALSVIEELEAEQIV